MIKLESSTDVVGIRLKKRPTLFRYIRYWNKTERNQCLVGFGNEASINDFDS